MYLTIFSNVVDINYYNKAYVDADAFCEVFLNVNTSQPYYSNNNAEMIYLVGRDFSGGGRLASFRFGPSLQLV